MEGEPGPSTTGDVKLSELLALLSESPEGLERSDIADAYRQKFGRAGIAEQCLNAAVERRLAKGLVDCASTRLIVIKA